MLDVVESKIHNSKSGAKLILGSGIKLEEMQKLVTYCESLESEGQIKIINKHQETKTGQHLIDSLVIQKL